MATNQAAFNAVVIAVQNNIVTLAPYLSAGVLALSGQGITDQDAIALAAALQNNTALTRLYLYTNLIGDTGANAIWQALNSSNFSLVFLGLSDNSAISTTTINSIATLITRNNQKALSSSSSPTVEQPFSNASDATPSNGPSTLATNQPTQEMTRTANGTRTTSTFYPLTSFPPLQNRTLGISPPAPQATPSSRGAVANSGLVIGVSVGGVIIIMIIVLIVIVAKVYRHYRPEKICPQTKEHAEHIVENPICDDALDDSGNVATGILPANESSIVETKLDEIFIVGRAVPYIGPNSGHLLDNSWSSDYITRAHAQQLLNCNKVLVFDFDDSPHTALPRQVSEPRKQFAAEDKNGTSDNKTLEKLTFFCPSTSPGGAQHNQSRSGSFSIPYDSRPRVTIRDYEGQNTYDVPYLVSDDSPYTPFPRQVFEPRKQFAAENKKDTYDYKTLGKQTFFSLSTPPGGAQHNQSRSASFSIL